MSLETGLTSIDLLMDSVFRYHHWSRTIYRWTPPTPITNHQSVCNSRTENDEFLVTRWRKPHGL